jgi:hypothetical protein
MATYTVRCSQLSKGERPYRISTQLEGAAGSAEYRTFHDPTSFYRALGYAGFGAAGIEQVRAAFEAGEQMHCFYDRRVPNSFFQLFTADAGVTN